MLNAHYTIDINGEKAKVHISGLIPCENLTGNASALHLRTIQDLSKPWMTEHSSVASFKVDTFDIEDCRRHTESFPEVGALIKLSYFWSGLSDDYEMLCQTIHSGCSDELVFSGYIWVKDMFDRGEVNQVVSNWAILQTEKMTHLASHVSSLNDDEFFIASQNNAILEKIRNYFN
ncbi:hypothetical protein [Photobacterium galatheae]|uniref:Uncharacterized protein n=1 Tax=Photobacterium galatheae TaxID=1654360 RepID=A0A066RPH6_9GAMM|nr:hypothetical protein [Photobacterium galatheae]KDM91021.1 hypothetical protein EA58_14825 [Photobacterium galatheae]MCM0149028.1 hypothetical protein [Photobacterium galatheae]